MGFGWMFKKLQLELPWNSASWSSLIAAEWRFAHGEAPPKHQQRAQLMFAGQNPVQHITTFGPTMLVHLAKKAIHLNVDVFVETKAIGSMKNRYYRTLPIQQPSLKMSQVRWDSSGKKHDESAQQTDKPIFTWTAKSCGGYEHAATHSRIP